MATPTACTIYKVSADFFPWDATLADQQSTQIFGLESGPHGRNVPRPDSPLHPEPGSRNIEPRPLALTAPSP